MSRKKKITYRRATIDDLKSIVSFVDYWLAGRAKNQGEKNAGNDYFVTIKQHITYLKKCFVLLALHKSKIVGWAVKQRNNVLIHLLIDAHFKGLGIGRDLLKRLNPDVIRSKSDQQTGDPCGFYEKHGYCKFSNIRIGKKSNIDLMVRKA